MLVSLLLPVLEGGHEVNHLQVPNWAVFLIAFVAFLIALSAIRGIGKGRPHS